MRKFALGVLIAVAVSLVTTGCQNNLSDDNATKQGSLSIFFDDHVSRSILPTVSMSPTSYVVTGSGPSSAAFAKTVSGASTVTIEALAFGDWTVAIVAKNADGTEIGSGSGTVTVISNSTVSLSVAIVPFAGIGSLNLALTWPAAQVQTADVVAGLLPPSGTARSLAFTVDGSAGSASFSATDVASGYHTLSLKLQDNGYTVMGAVEVVRIVKGHTTTGNFEFKDINKATGTLNVNISADMGDPLIVAISGSAATIAANKSLSLSAAVSDFADNVTYVWYVNGDAVETGSAYSFGNIWNEGYYRVDVTAFSADGMRAGSTTTQIEVIPAIVGTQPSWFTYTTSGSNVTITGLSDEWVASTAPDKNDLVIPSMIEGKTVSYLADYAFKNRSTLKSVVFPETVTGFGRDIFSDCVALTSVTLPSNIYTIPTSMFQYCTSLTSVTIPSKVRTLSSNVFFIARG